MSEFYNPRKILESPTIKNVYASDRDPHEKALSSLSAFITQDETLKPKEQAELEEHADNGAAAGEQESAKIACEVLADSDL